MNSYHNRTEKRIFLAFLILPLLYPTSQHENFTDLVKNWNQILYILMANRVWPHFPLMEIFMISTKLNQ